MHAKKKRHFFLLPCLEPNYRNESDVGAGVSFSVTFAFASFELTFIGPQKDTLKKESLIGKFSAFVIKHTPTKPQRTEINDLQRN